MPLYHYLCSSCGHDWDQMLRIDKRFDPVNTACPQCNADESVALIVGAPSVVTGAGDIWKKTDGAFRDRMKEIKAKNPRSTVKTGNLSST